MRIRERSRIHLCAAYAFICINSFIPLFNKHLLEALYEPGLIVAAGKRTSPADRCLFGIYVLRKEADKVKEVSKCSIMEKAKETG